MHDTGCLGLLHWDDPEGWYGEGGGRRVQDGEQKKEKKEKKKFIADKTLTCNGKLLKTKNSSNSFDNRTGPNPIYLAPKAHLN